MRYLSQLARPYLASLLVLLMFAAPLSIMAQRGGSGARQPSLLQDNENPAKANEAAVPAAIPVANVEYTDQSSEAKPTPQRRGARNINATSPSPSIVDDPQPYAVSTFSNPAPITFNDAAVDGTITAGTPYPSNITVAGFAGSIGKVTVSVNNLSHTFPRDIELLLVSPTGVKVKFMSDACGSGDIVNQTFTFSDTATQDLPFATTAATPCTTGTYRPINYTQAGDNDQMPAPAPALPYVTVLADFNGLTGAQVNGTWSLYIGDDGIGDTGTIAGGWTLNLDNAAVTAPAPGDIKISEFRTRGPGGTADEFVELYNNTNAPITVMDATPDGNIATSDGWRLDVAQGAATTAFVVLAQDLNPAGPIAIPARGHLLFAIQPAAPSPAGNTYSLSGYSAPDISVNAAVSGAIPDDAGIAMYRTANTGLLNAANTLDAVGFGNVTAANHFEGTKLTPAAGVTTSNEHSFVRKMPNSNNGVPVDTGQNQSDFELVEINGATLGGRAAVLGAPGPENLGSPIDRTASFGNSLIDTTAPQSSPPNRVRVGAGNSGTLSIRRRFTNNTGVAVTRLRFRVVDITVLNNQLAGQADVRPTNSATTAVASGSFGAVSALSTTIETPPTPGASGGGLNTSLTVAIPGGTLANGATIDLNFTLNVVQAGTFRYFIIIQAIP
jgi:subtilisin-like proprotein convertase family protein